ncbi:MAG: hypothetical protein AAFZ15_12870 [Bacteroidota bacterium]
MIDWDDLIKSIKKRKCVLFLGPGGFSDPNGIPLQKALRKYLFNWESRDQYIENFYRRDGFLSLKPGSKSRRKVVDQVRDFYKQPFPETEELFKELAKVKLPLIVSLMPDDLLAETFRQNGVNNLSVHYSKDRPQAEELKELPNDRTVIYRFLGHLDEQDEGLILTYEDFYAFMDGIGSGEDLDIAVREAMQQAEYLLMAGLPYDKWYTQLLIRCLQKHAENCDSDRYAAGYRHKKTEVFYRDFFNITFVDDEVSSFIQRLVKECGERAPGLLRKLSAPVAKTDLEPLNFDDLYTLISKAEQGKVLGWLVDFLTTHRQMAHPVFADLIVKKSEWQSNEEEMLGDRISHEVYSRTKSNITYKLLSHIGTVNENFGHLITQPTN